MIREMFSRSLSKYGVKYTSYIGDGDAKVHKYLTENPPYRDVAVKKVEDVNHFAKRMLSRIMKIRRENKSTILSDGKRLSGKGRMTITHAIKFKIFFAKAIREAKNDLQKLYEKSWAIFKHYYSSDQELMHEWCDIRWCKYLQAQANGERFSHQPTSSIPRACLDLIKPVFDDLCSHRSLERVISGGCQNANEAFHSLVWTMAPKHRFCSSLVIRAALGLSTIIYNNGYQSLCKLFEAVVSSVGYYSARCFWNLDQKKHRSSIREGRRRASAKTATSFSTMDDDSCGDEDTTYHDYDGNNSNDSLDDGLENISALIIDDDDDYEMGGDD